MFLLEKFFCESTYCALQTYWEVLCLNCWREFLKMLGGDMQKYWEIIFKKLSLSKNVIRGFRKTTKTCSVIILKGIMKTCWEVFCINTKNFFPKIRICVLPKSWEVLFKYIKRCLAELLRAVLHSDKNEQLRELIYFLLEHGSLF